MLFYLRPTSVYASAAKFHLGVPGGRRFREKPCWCARARYCSARRHPKSPEVGPEAPKVVKVEPKSSLLETRGTHFGENSR